jgi:hypothetical protein
MREFLTSHCTKEKQFVVLFKPLKHILQVGNSCPVICIRYQKDDKAPEFVSVHDLDFWGRAFNFTTLFQPADYVTR